MRTPAASEAERGHQPEDKSKARGGQVTLSGQMMTYFPTPTASDRTDRQRSENWHGNDLVSTVKADIPKANWGKFEPAIRRWEETLGRPAPAPTQPDGKDGAPRLSADFTEWMMGVPFGWITDCGLTRNESLKACGNGVVPQQAELALRVLLQGITIPRGGGQVNLPTPTVSDTFTDNLESSQQKPGSMHSVTLPQAVKWVASE
jgi:DNA (cytosine-5)-methyltransferase 1